MELGEEGGRRGPHDFGEDLDGARDDFGLLEVQAREEIGL